MEVTGVSETKLSPVYRIEHPEHGTHFCDNPSCGDNYFHVNAIGMLVCNGCEIPARLIEGVEFVLKDMTAASGREFNDRLQ